jgi:tripartite-type tricarboxylate transporter receptor subunit TctC
VSSLNRLEELPDVPTVSDTLPGFEALTWFGFVAPAALPKEIADRLATELKAVGQDPATRARVQALSAVPSGLTGDAFGNFIASELAKWGPVVEKAGIKPQ